MLRFLGDRANAITAGGLMLSAGSLILAVAGRAQPAVALAMWAWICDQIDGIVARRTAQHRTAEVAKLGKALDGYADVIHGLIIPSVVILLLRPGSVETGTAVLVLISTGCLRLAYYDAFGLDAGIYFGIPVSYNLPLLALLFLTRGSVGPDSFLTLVSSAFILLGVLHISPLRVPALRGAGYPIAISAAVIVSAALCVG